MNVPVDALHVVRLRALSRDVRAAAVTFGRAVDALGPGSLEDGPVVSLDLAKLEAAGAAFLAMGATESTYNAAHRQVMQAAADAIAQGRFSGE